MHALSDSIILYYQRVLFIFDTFQKVTFDISNTSAFPD